MTLINQLIAEARKDPRPEYLSVPGNKIRQVCEHARLISAATNKVALNDLVQMALDGKMKMLNIPIRVIGAVPKKYSGA